MDPIGFRQNEDLPTVPQPEAVPQPEIELARVIRVGAPRLPVGVMVSMLRVTRVLVPGSVAVIVLVSVIVGPGSTGVEPGFNDVVVLSTPEVMIPVELVPIGKQTGQHGSPASVGRAEGSNGPSYPALKQ